MSSEWIVIVAVFVIICVTGIFLTIADEFNKR